MDSRLIFFDNEIHPQKRIHRNYNHNHDQISSRSLVSFFFFLTLEREI